ncbi:ABC transporter permease [Aromatoleum buckelii]|uniref:Transport permease protein n=1 Tax=Aromatoleum buckelii TaxID=200254 RepID=A0ABX1N492_9RHOO|nr:ABC transporter permease [Aromatoleum buckelii]MCK0511889.1 ABC transporter permease [Aromatoleum buckelii]
MRPTLQILWMWLRRDIKSRYAGSLVGMAWAFLGPLATMGLFYVLFAHIFKVRVPELTTDTGYLYYLLAGLVPWLAIAEALSRGTGVIVAYEQFLQKQVFSVEVLPLSVVFSALLPQFVGTAVLFGLLAVAGVGEPIRWLLWPGVLGLQVLMVSGIVLVLSVLAVHLRDLVHGLPVLIQFLFYATPILFSMTMVPEAYHPLFLLNPFAVLIQAHQAILLGLPFGFLQAAALLGWTLVLGVGGIALFRVLRPTVGDGV